MPWRMYSATGTLVRSWSFLSCSSCSGVMYTVVEIFLRLIRITIYDDTHIVKLGRLHVTTREDTLQPCVRSLRLLCAYSVLAPRTRRRTPTPQPTPRAQPRPHRRTSTRAAATPAAKKSWRWT